MSVGRPREHTALAILGLSVLAYLPALRAGFVWDDIDLYVLTVPGGVSPSLTLVAADTSTGSTVDRTVPLTPGQYYAVVVDFAGVPTRYAICIGGCAIFPLAQVPSAPYAVRRRAADPVAAPWGRRPWAPYR